MAVIKHRKELVITALLITEYCVTLKNKGANTGDIIGAIKHLQPGRTFCRNSLVNILLKLIDEGRVICVNPDYMWGKRYKLNAGAGDE